MIKNLRLWGFSATLIALTAGLGLWFILNSLYPNVFTIILLFVFIFIACASVAVPISIFLNQRFAKENWHVIDSYRLIRHGAESGLLGTILVYIELRQTLDWSITAVLIGVFVLMETFFLTGMSHRES
ncbi:MAG: hypothetical protein B6242_13570 [Anaerolineaceae bacterium 4572_78]|nr:MAG: hypothetical protein B6242_13570 [Anaerolineaceae bacterium 4572_78]